MLLLPDDLLELFEGLLTLLELFDGCCTLELPEFCLALELEELPDDRFTLELLEDLCFPELPVDLWTLALPDDLPWDRFTAKLEEDRLLLPDPL